MDIQWNQILEFSMSPAEIVARGTLMYWFLFLLFRFVLRRDVGNVGISDFLFVVIVADASQNGMAGDGNTVCDAVALVLTLMFWNYMIDLGAYVSPTLRRLAEPLPLLLVQDGKMLRKNMRREFVTEDEIMAKLREKGIEDLGEVKKMYVESDGEISVLRKDGQ